MTPSIRKLITIIIIALAFMLMACNTPGETAIRNYEQPETPWRLRMQPTDVPFIPYGGE
jgi:starvation-inducible outer membrane lipoprotein